MISCCIILPLRGPTCKIARFQAQLKVPSWTECGKREQSGAEVGQAEVKPTFNPDDNIARPQVSDICREFYKTRQEILPRDSLVARNQEGGGPSPSSCSSTPPWTSSSTKPAGIYIVVTPPGSK